MLSTGFGITFYVALGILLLGSAYRLWQVCRPMRVFPRPLTPAPFTLFGVFWRIFSEWIGFRSLFRADKILWLLAWLFHIALLGIFIRHLRYIIYPVWTWVVDLQTFGIWSGWIFWISSLLLLFRRIWISRVRYFSYPSDYLWLIILNVISFSGLCITYYFHTDIVQLKLYLLGLLSFRIETMPTDHMLLIHIGSALLLLICFPFSKLWHGIGAVFHPSRIQRDKAR